MTTLADLWLALVALSLLWTLADVVRHPSRTMPIMNLVWPLMALYFGPVGVALYLTLSGRSSTGHAVARPVLAPGAPTSHAGMAMSHMGHAAGPLWQRALRSSTHCMAGCALGDLVAMLLVEGLGLFGGMLLGEVLLGSVLAFALGLFVFQALPVMAERGIGFAQSLTIALQADTMTISAYLVGQIAALYALQAWMAPAMGTGLSIGMFVTMQAAMAVGFLTTYPANYVLVRAGIKEGM